MFRKQQNQSIVPPPVGSQHSRSVVSSTSEHSASTPPSPIANDYPSIDEKHKKFSLHSSGAGGVGDSTSSDEFKDDEQSPDNGLSDLANQRLIKALSEQSYHLPGYTYWEDWRQYFFNNHPMFGICWHHKLHPIGWGMRALCFLASIVFGLVITNIVWLWAEGLEDNSAVFSVDVGAQAQRGTNVTQYVIDINEDNQVEVTKDMIVLWTFGGALHGFFDNTIWTLTLCSFCDPGGRFEHLHKYKRFGVGLLSFGVLAIAAIATLSVVLRASLESDEEVQFNQLKKQGLLDEATDFKGQKKESYEFLLSFAVELAIALLFHFPVIGFILFSGCLNIRGKVTMFGGRPFEVLREEEELAEINGGVDPETGEPIKRTTDNMSNKERSSLLNSGARKADDEEGKVSGMANFWNKKVDDSSTSKGSLDSSAKSEMKNSIRSNPPAARRGSTGSVHSSNTQSTVSQAPQTPQHTRRVYMPQGARAYTGGRVYVPHRQGGPGRGTPAAAAAASRRGATTPSSSQVYPRGRPARVPLSPGRAAYPQRAPRTASPHRGASPQTWTTSPSRSYPRNGFT